MDSRDAEICHKNKVHIVPVSTSSAFWGIRKLAETHKPPPWIFAKGDLSVLNKPILAVVGTRRATTYGRNCALDFSWGLSAIGFAIASGLAHGIDASAHRGSIATPQASIAVLAQGLLRPIYPAENRGLAQEILNSGGLLISQYSPEEGAQKYHFPERNFIIAGLSLGVLVIEAPKKSGALITAEAAVEAGREVFVVPGACSETFEGSHLLIQEGAHLAQNIGDVVDALPVKFSKLDAALLSEEYDCLQKT